MLLFRDEGHVDRWCDARGLGRGGLLTLEQAWRLAQGWYGQKLSPTWRRHTREEAEALLAQVGLTGRFWHLHKS
jgi:hypothetical protein